MAVLHQPAGLAAKRLAVVGGGSVTSSTPPRCAKRSAPRCALKQKGVKNLAWWLSSGRPADAEAAVEGAILGNFEPDRTQAVERGQVARSISLCRCRERSRAGTSRSSADASSAEAQNFTRELVNEPANRMTPMRLAERASAMAAEIGLECEVLDQDRMRQLGMGSLLGVAQGSAEPPALIIVRYQPAKRSKSRTTILAWSAKASPSIPAASPSSPPRAWRR